MHYIYIYIYVVFGGRGVPGGIGGNRGRGAGGLILFYTGSSEGGEGLGSPALGLSGT